MNHLQNEIIELKKKTGTLILAHNYVIADIQDIADFCGDSLELSIKAQKANAKRIVFCGVRFMAETAKILSPDSSVFLPCSTAGCPMADMVSPNEIAKMRETDEPDSVYVAYVNTTATTKSHVDYCCTSGNAAKVLSSIPAEKRVVFLPDCNLGSNMQAQLHRDMRLWNGCCPIHDSVIPEMIIHAKKLHPKAIVLVHPECRPEIIKLADYALSTGGMLKFARESDFQEFVIVTECGILHRLRNENPAKLFYSVEPQLVCRDMKKITLQDVKNALEGKSEEILLPADLMNQARIPIERMLSIS